MLIGNGCGLWTFDVVSNHPHVYTARIIVYILYWIGKTIRQLANWAVATQSKVQTGKCKRRRQRQRQRRRRTSIAYCTHFIITFSSLSLSTIFIYVSLMKIFRFILWIDEFEIWMTCGNKCNRLSTINQKCSRWDLFYVIWSVTQEWKMLASFLSNLHSFRVNELCACHINHTMWLVTLFSRSLWLFHSRHNHHLH